MANLATINNNILADSGIDPLSLIVGTGTVNYVPKFTSEDTLAISQIFDNGTSVGIGTSSPTLGKLQVEGDGIVINTEGTAASKYLYFRYSNGGDLRSDSFLTFSTGGSPSEKMRITEGGNIGIGTSTPTALLQVANSGRALAVYRVQGTNRTTFYDNDFAVNNDGGGADGFIYGSNVGGSFPFDGYGELIIQANPRTGYANGISLVTGTTSPSIKLRILEGGNVGIGTINPSYKLEVNGNIASLNSSAAGLFSISGTRSIAAQSFSADWNYLRSNGAPLVFGTQDAQGLYIRVNDIDRITVNNVGAVRFNNYGSGSFTGTPTYNLAVDASGNIIETAGGVVDGSGTANYVTKWIDANTIGNSAIYQSPSGGIGIYNTNPTRALEVGGSIVVGMDNPAPFWNALFKDYSDGSGLYISSVNGGGGKYIAGNSYYYNSSFWRSDKTVASAINLDNGAVVFYTNSGLTPNVDYLPTERMRITDAGNVGIGTSSPIQKLQVNGSIALNTVTNGSSRYYTYPDANHSWYYDDDVVGSSADVMTYYQNFLIRLQDTTNVFLINGIGNVGIGTTNPTVKLQVENNSHNYIQVNSSVANVQTAINVTNSASTSRASLSWEDGTRGAYADLYSSTYLTLTTQSSEKMRITAAGNVGIGTSTPSYRLEVNGSVYGSTTAQFGTGYIDGTQAGWAIFGSNSSSNGIKIVLDGSILRNDIVIATSGLIGIGTGAPTERLHVSGNLRVTGAYYDSNNSAGTSGQVLSSTATGTDWVSLSEITGVDGTGTANYVAKWLDANTITNSLLYDDGTNVGIGTTSPAYKLDVAGASRSDYHIFRSNQSAPTADAFIFRPADNTVALGTANAERMRITAAGNVGFGTTTPKAKAAFASGLPTSIPTFTDTTNGIVVTDGGAIYGRLGVSNFSAIGAGYPTYLQAGDFDGAAYYNILLNPLGGNVGIGTTNPGQKLTLINGTFQIGGTSTFSDNIEIGRVGSDNNMAFATGGTERMRITAAGNVSIGNTNDTYKLDVTGAARFTGQVNSETLFYVVAAPPAINGGLITVRDTVTATNVTSFAGVFFNSTPGNDYSIGKLTENGTGYLQIRNANSGAELLRMTASGVTTFSSSVTAASLIKSGGTSSQYLMADGSISTTSNIAPRYVATVNVSQTAYTQICTIVGGSLASAVNMSFQGTSNNVVVNVTAQILVNHYQDIVITTTSGFYSQLSIRVISNNNESYSVEAQVISNLGQTTDLNIEVFPLNSESVTFGGSPLTPGTTLVHTTRSGVYVSASEPMSISSGSDIYAAGNVGIGTTSPAAKLHAVGSGIVNIVQSSNTVSYTQYYNSSTGTNSTNDGLTVGLNGIDAYIFSREAGNLVIGTSDTERMRITSDGNVGIGTTSPSDKLTVLGSAATTFQGGGIYNSYTYGNSDKAESRFNLGKIEAGTYQPMGAIGAFPSTNTDSSNGILSFYTRTSQSVTEKMRITSGGNVGIGTSSPTALLTVAGTTDLAWAASTSKLQISRSGTVARLQNYDNGSAAASLALQWEGGNVGIGITTPTAKLHTDGTTKLGGGTLQVSTDQTFVTNYTYTFRDAVGINNPNSLSAASATTVMSIGSMSNGVSLITTGSIGVGTTTPNRALTVNGVVGVSSGTANVPQLVLSSDANGNYISSTYMGTSSYVPMIFETSGSERMRITAAGNVGIGTTSPTTPLEISHATGNALKIATNDSTTNNNAGVVIENVASSISTTRRSVFIMDPTSGTGTGGDYFYITSYGNGLTSLTNAKSDGILVFGTADTERMRITSAGNVGIGTSSPTAALQVANSSRALAVYRIAGTNRTTFYDNDFAVNNDGGGADGFIYGSNVGGSFPFNGYGEVIMQANPRTGYSNGISFVTGTTAPTIKMRIVEGGNVGIGTDSPSDELTVNSAGNSTGIAIQRSGVTKGLLEIGSSSDTFAISATSATGILTFATNSSERMRITDGGNVGINTSTPIARLHVQESSNARALIQVVGGEVAGDNAGLYFKSAVNYSDAYMKGGVFFSNNGTGHGRGNLIFATNNTANGDNVSIADAKLTITAAGAATFTSSVTATGFFESSDARLKVVVDEDYRHNAIANIKPKFYEKNGKFEAGYIAQDVQKIYEHAVSLGTDGYLSLSYGQIHTLKIAYLEDTVEEIKRKIAYLEQQLNNK